MSSKKSASSVPPKKTGKNWFNKIVAWIHLWPSLVSAVILIFVCLTGTLIVYCDEIVSLSAGKARYVTEQREVRLEPEELIKRLEARFPDRNIPGYMVTYKDPKRSVRFNMFSREAGLRMVYVDPYTGEVLKDDGTIYFFYITAHLHNSLLLGKSGQWIVDIASLIFLVELITGLILWWPRKWTKATRDASFKIKWKAKFKRVNYDLHNVLGFYALGICLVLTVTGLIIAFHPWAEFTVKAFGGNPSHEWMETLSEHQPERNTASMNTTIADLFNAHPDKQEAIIYTYALNKQGHYVMALAKSVGLKSVEGAEMFAIDRYSGGQIELSHANRMHLVVENVYWNLHMGKWMGQWGKLFTFLGGLIATSLPITGFYIWWGRRKKGTKKKQQRSQPIIAAGPSSNITKAFRPRAVGIIIFMISSALISYAQQTGTIKGRVVNDQGGVALASILLVAADTDRKHVKGMVADSLGYFELSGVPAGNYLLLSNNLGYLPYESEMLSLAPGRLIDLGALKLVAQSQQLEEVEVRVQRPLIEQRADRLVMNVENSILAEGNTALELLERAPGVAVDQDGNLTLRGKQGVTVMINDKLTYLSQRELANLLKGTPSTAIATIEVITNPSARYDAAGNSGIINIRLKKNLQTGTHGNVHMNYGRGRRNRYGMGVNLNHRNRFANIFGSYDYAYRGESERFLFDRRFFGEGSGTVDRISNQQTSTNEPLNTHNFKVGLDVDLSIQTVLGVLVNGNIGSYTNESVATNRIRSASGTLLSDAFTDNFNDESWRSLTYNLNLTQRFGRDGQQLTADLDYSRSTFQADQLLETTFRPVAELPPLSPSSRRGNIPAATDVYVGKADYSRPLSAKATLEAGWKSSYVKADNDANYDTVRMGAWEPDWHTTNHFRYEEQIHAAYVSYKHQVAGMEIQAGLRAEHTAVKGHQITTDSLFERNYTQLFPSLFLRKPLNERHRLQASYSRRIERPDYFDLNPFRFFRDQNIFFEGNPYLQPELTHSVEFGYAWTDNYLFSLFYSHTDDVMTSVINQIDETNTTILRPENLRRLRYYGMSGTLAVKPMHFWSTSNFINLFRNVYEGSHAGGELENSAWSYTVNSQHTLQFGRGLSMEATAQYFSKSVYGVFTRDPYFVLSAGIQQQLFNRQATLKLALADVFASRSFIRDVNYQHIRMRENIDMDSRIVTFSLSYRFGNSNIQTRSRDSGSEDIQKRVKGAG